MFLILSKFEPHVLNFLGVVHKGLRSSAGRGVVQADILGGGGSSDANVRTF